MRSGAYPDLERFGGAQRDHGRAGSTLALPVRLKSTIRCRFALTGMLQDDESPAQRSYGSEIRVLGTSVYGAATS
jgi:hypothetical protein